MLIFQTDLKKDVKNFKIKQLSLTCKLRRLLNQKVTLYLLMNAFLEEEAFRCKHGLDLVRISEFKIELEISHVKQSQQQYACVIKLLQLSKLIIRLQVRHIVST